MDPILNLSDKGYTMPPTEGNHDYDDKESDPLEVSLTPQVPLSNLPLYAESFSSSSSEVSVGKEYELDWGTHIQDPMGKMIPIPPTLKELLNKAHGSIDVQNMTSATLCVISSDISLQHIGIHTPNLTELILDGSVISSLRDLGCGLKKLRILRVNRCHLSCLDGTFGLQELEELYAAYNTIANPSPCAHLPVIKHIDLSNNSLKNINTLAFLNLCKTLESLDLIGNKEIESTADYRKSVKTFVKSLKRLDGEELTDVPSSKGNDKVLTKIGKSVLIKKPLKLANNIYPNAERESQFYVKFMPKVLSPRAATAKNDFEIRSNNASTSELQAHRHVFKTYTSSSVVESKSS